MMGGVAATGAATIAGGGTPTVRESVLPPRDAEPWCVASQSPIPVPATATQRVLRIASTLIREGFFDETILFRCTSNSQPENSVG
jgi:hypothetical protein